MSHDGCFARLPIAHLVYNLIPPMGNIPSLLTFEEVRMGILDLQLHAMYIPDGPNTALDVRKSVYEITSVYPMLQEDRYLCSISHIFTGYERNGAQILRDDPCSWRWQCGKRGI
ncbi:hypothetical protein SO802_009575 [Lithocarpus litseifolius]|uniref:Uncharacterized protein n=1 Tax=Lithocarpus litseifolius TaxID=425828 RepID=A0AAW2DBT8_9ROSI